MKTFLSLFFISILIGVKAGEINYLLRPTFGFGLDRQSLDYDGQKINYSPGGGVGLETGIDYTFAKGFGAYATAGFLYNLSMKKESSAFYSNETSFSFSKCYLTLGAQYAFTVSEGVFNKFIVGSGLNMNFPGALKRKENNKNLGTIYYKNALGYQIEYKVRLKFSYKLSLDVGMRYRYLTLEPDRYVPPKTNTSTKTPELTDIDASGIDILVGLVVKL